MNITIIIAIAVAGLVGIGLGYALRRLILLSQKSTLELEIKEKRLAAKEKAAQIKEAAEAEAKELVANAEETTSQKTADLQKKEKRLEKEQAELKKQAEQLVNAKKEAEKQQTRLESKLEEAAQMDQATARDQLFSHLKKEHADDLQARSKKLELAGKERIKKQAKEMLTDVLERLSRSVDPEILSTTVELSEDDLKGKIIGKDGRNIRAFQQATGVELVIDDTPRIVTISSYDPIRRAVAKYALDTLLEDGRVQPARIERFVADAKKKVDQITKEKGQAAVQELNLLSLDERIVALLGRLHFRTSYGQNVLQHSIEAAHIAQMLAHELDLNVEVAKTGALLHDIGKAADHELSGSHVEIGIHILKKFGAEEVIIDAMKSHHDDYPHASLEAVIVQVADGVSGARPGARKQSIESYIARLKELEEIADKISGVVNSYAIEAGREIRVFVNSQTVNDPQARDIARQIATQIEERVSYPGEVKVHVIRESRLTHYAR